MRARQQAGHTRRRLCGSGLWSQRRDAHLAHQSLHAFAIDATAFANRIAMNDDLDSLLSGQGGAVSETETNEVRQQEAQVSEGEGQQEQISEGGEGETQGQSKMVPHEALHAEKQKVKRYTEEVSEFRS
jgi:hypothetical protein